MVGKSFKISGTKLETTNYFEIEYDASRFNELYDIIESPQNVSGPSNWGIMTFPYDEKRKVL